MAIVIFIMCCIAGLTLYRALTKLVNAVGKNVLIKYLND